MADRTAVVKLTIDSSGVQTGANKAASALDQTARKGILSAQSIGGAFSKVGGIVGGEVGDLLDKVGAGFQNISDHAKTAAKSMQVVGAAGLAIGTGLMALGSKDQQAFNQLSTAIAATGGDMADYKDEVEKTVSAQENFGHGAADTQQALAKLTESLGSPSKAMEHMGVVADLAAAKHISLTDAASMVAKILAGKGGKALSEYGITMGKSKDATKNGTEALDKLALKLKGQAAAAVDTFTGKVGVMKTKIEDGAAAFGQKYGPAITGVAGALAIGGTIMETFRGAQVAATAATVAQAGATEAATVAEDGLNASFLANPIVLVVAAIVALIAVAVLCYKHFQTFRNIVDGAWNGIKTAASVAWNGILKPVFTVWLAIIKAVWTAVQFLWKNVVVPAFNAIKTIVQTVWNQVLKPVFSGWKTIIEDIWGAIQWLWKNVATPAFAALGKAVQAADRILSPIFNAWKAILDVIGGAISKVASFFGGGGHSSSGSAHAAYGGPHRAAGGPVSAGMAYTVGELGPETFVPSQSGSIIPAGGMSANIVVVLDGQPLYRSTQRVALRQQNRNGFAGLAH